MGNENTMNETILSEKPLKSHSRKQKEEFNEKVCEIICYNQHQKTLDIKFDEYGIRIKNVESFNKTGTTIKIKYKGTIGTPGFMVEV